MGKSVTAKLGNMRKPQVFTVYPKSQGSNLMTVQSDKSIGQFDPETGKGLLNTKGCYFMHLNPFLGAKDFVFPKDFIQNCQDAQYKKGDEIGGGGVVIG